MQYYSIIESSSNNGIYEFKLDKLNTGEENKKINKYLSKIITLIDQNILIAIEQDKKISEITEVLKNTTVSPIFYFFERLLQNNADIDLLSHDDIPRFNTAHKKISRKINTYKDRSIKNEDLIKNLVEIISPSNIDNNYIYKTQEYLNFFYRKSE
ncbi:TPA: hypothetical protein QB592_001590, partial [Pasteurella multocida]|nr:hypothetical protein [Pasteurella multocida]